MLPDAYSADGHDEDSKMYVPYSGSNLVGRGGGGMTAHTVREREGAY